MTPKQRVVKRTIIIIVYLVILSLLGTELYFIFRTKPTCSDGQQNQNEEGVDCGGPCSTKCENIPNIENIRTLEKAVLPGSEGKFDAMAKINNPNPQFGVAQFDYSFNLLDSNGKIIGQSEGSSFIFPAQTKYILAFNLSAQAQPRSVEFKIRSFKWTKFSEYEEPLIQIYSKEFNLVAAGSNFATLKAKIKNQSSYDFRTITAKAVIRNDQNFPVALNQTSVNDVRVNEEREIVFNWGSRFQVGSGTPSIEIETEANFFSDDNFMKKYGSSDQYKTYDINPGQ
jgi:hypothetical protein